MLLALLLTLASYARADDPPCAGAARECRPPSGSGVSGRTPAAGPTTAAELARSLRLQAQNRHAADPKKYPAPSDVDVAIYNEYKDGQKDAAIAREIAADKALTRNRVHVGRHTADVLDALRRELVAGNRIEHLRVSSHGKEGSADILSDIGPGDYRKLADLSPLFKPGAEIKLSVCESGEGLKGALLIRELGEALLRANGGSVTAPKGSIWSFAGTGVSPNGMLVYTVKAGGGGTFSEDLRLKERMDAMRVRTNRWRTEMEQWAQDLDAAGLGGARAKLLEGISRFETLSVAGEASLDAAVAAEEKFEDLVRIYEGGKLKDAVDARRAR